MNEQRREKMIAAAYEAAQEKYAEYGVDVEDTLRRFATVSISLQCWQGDDVGGFEKWDGDLVTGGLAATGNYPGKARTADELRNDLDMVYRLIPGTHRLNLHAIYAETGGKHVERNDLRPEHFSAWIDWAKRNGHGLDFNPTCFSHPKANSGFTLSHYDAGIRQFWVEHCIACRKIGEHMGRVLGTPSVTNIWIPDGFKDTPVDRLTPRKLLIESLDKILAERIDPQFHLDAVESKLFGLGSESFVTGSHDLYLAYAVTHRLLVCLDSGHFHPTESVADKISSILLFLDKILLHISRGVRWDSDHVVVSTNELQAIAQEVVRGGFLPRVHIGLDYFDASINRLAAWVIGARSTLYEFLTAMLEPVDVLRSVEVEGDYTRRLAILEECKQLPSAAVWDYYCWRNDIPVGLRFLDSVRGYEKTELSKRA
jgi:L-rhamnose isomerase